jgi:hypothetical protein
MLLCIVVKTTLSVDCRTIPLTKQIAKAMHSQRGTLSAIIMLIPLL